jgi:two-component system sensor histidine kinase UhpB
MRLSLQQRLLLLITALMALLCVAGGIYIVRRAQNDIRGEVRSATSLVERYLRAKLAVAEMEWRQNNDLLPQLELARLRDVRHIQVSFYTRAGALAESSADAQAPAAQAPRWFAWLVQHSFRPIEDSATPVAFDGVHIGDIVIHPDPSFEMAEIWNVARGLLGLLLTFFVVVNALVWWAVVRAMRPLARAREALQRLGAGDLQTRLPAFALPELAGLSRDFNRMADTLERSLTENRHLTRQLLKAQDDERTRIAHELHDELGQCVTAIHADAVAIRQADEASAARESAAAIADAATQIKTLLRGMLQRLRPAALDTIGLGAALSDLVASFRQRHTAVVCRLRIDPAATDLKDDAAMAVYRLVQEGLTNVARHAHATHVEVDVAMDTTRQSADAGTASLRVALSDDGVGFDPEPAAPGWGLIGMRERVRGLGGEVRIESAIGKGTRILAQVPRAAAPRPQ